MSDADERDSQIVDFEENGVDEVPASETQDETPNGYQAEVVIPEFDPNNIAPGIIPQVLFVTRFKWSTTNEASVREIMEPFGPLKSVHMKPKACFVEFDDAAHAHVAKHTLHCRAGLGTDSLIVDFKQNNSGKRFPDRDNRGGDRTGDRSGDRLLDRGSIRGGDRLDHRAVDRGNRPDFDRERDDSYGGRPRFDSRDRSAPPPPPLSGRGDYNNGYDAPSGRGRDGSYSNFPPLQEDRFSRPVGGGRPAGPPSYESDRNRESESYRGPPPPQPQHSSYPPNDYPSHSPRGLPGHRGPYNQPAAPPTLGGFPVRNVPVSRDYDQGHSRYEPAGTPRGGRSPPPSGHYSAPPSSHYQQSSYDRPPPPSSFNGSRTSQYSQQQGPPDHYRGGNGGMSGSKRGYDSMSEPAGPPPVHHRGGDRGGPGHYQPPPQQAPQQQYNAPRGNPSHSAPAPYHHHSNNDQGHYEYDSRNPPQSHGAQYPPAQPHHQQQQRGGGGGHYGVGRGGGGGGAGLSHYGPSGGVNEPGPYSNHGGRGGPPPPTHYDHHHGGNNNHAHNGGDYNYAKRPKY